MRLVMLEMLLVLEMLGEAIVVLGERSQGGQGTLEECPTSWREPGLRGTAKVRNSVGLTVASNSSGNPTVRICLAHAQDARNKNRPVDQRGPPS